MIMGLLGVVGGAVLGSFFASYVYRLGHSDMTSSRSICPACKRALAWFELVPVLSFLALRGQCRQCRARISPQYLAIELGTLAVFVLIMAFEPLREGSRHALLARDLFAASMLFLIAAVDLRYGIIPDEVTVPAIILIAAVNLFFDRSAALTASGMLRGLMAGGGFFLAQYLITRGGAVGDGDMRLGILLGVLLGLGGTVLALLLAYVVGALIAVLLLAMKKTTLQSRVPMAPFLSLGGVIALLWGEKIISFYASRFYPY